MYFGFSCLGVLSSILVIIGLRKNERSFLAPFILISAFDLIISLLHFILNIIFSNIRFDPLTGTLFITDFFIHCLNVSIDLNPIMNQNLDFFCIFQMYCLVCVVSQYQEFKEYGCENHCIIVSFRLPH